MSDKCTCPVPVCGGYTVDTIPWCTICAKYIFLKEGEETSNNVNNPKHYNSHPSGIDCIQITEHMGFCLGNAAKYIWRADHKNGIEDLEKAVWYLQREITKRKKEKK